MPPTVARHRSSPSFDKLLEQLNENELHLLLTDLNNSRDVHIPVAEAVHFYEKPRSRRDGHGLPAKRAVSSPLLSSGYKHDNFPAIRKAAVPPPLPISPLVFTTPSPGETLLVPDSPTSSSDADIDANDDKIVPSLPEITQRLPEQAHAARDDAEPAEPAEPAAYVNITPVPTKAPRSRGYKRISRPALPSPSTLAAQGQDLHALLAVYFFNGNDAAATGLRSPKLSSPRSMVDLRLLERQQQEDRYRPVELLEPMLPISEVGGTSIPFVLGKPPLRDVQVMDSLFSVLNEG